MASEPSLSEVSEQPIRPQCLLCEGRRHRAIFNEFGVDILQCQNCRHIFSTFAADPHYDGFWGEEVAEDEHFYWSKARATMHRDFFKRFVAGRSGRLLDMGCGLGFFVKAMASYTRWEAFGCEISPAAVRYARETLGLRNVVRSRLEDAEFPKGSFDLITLWDVLDHIPNPDPVLRRCHALLKEGGVCFIRTPNVFNQLLRARLKRLARGMRSDGTYLMARDHMHHYSVAGLRRLLERNAFSDIEFAHLHPIHSVSKRGTLAVRAAKNVCFEAVRALAMLSGGRMNFDNLFAIARKTSHHSPLVMSKCRPYTTSFLL